MNYHNQPELFLKSGIKYLYIKHHEHLKPTDKSLKLEDFWIKLRGTAYKSNGVSIGEKDLYLDEKYVDRSEQFKLYYELDGMMTDINVDNKAQANKIFNLIAKEKKFNKIFEFKNIEKNIKRIFVDGLLNKIVPKLEIGLELDSDAQFSLSPNKFEKNDYDKVKETHKNLEVLLKDPIIKFAYFLEVIAFGFPGSNIGTNEFHQKPYPNFYYLNKFEIMLAHEYIHAMQNCLVLKSKKVEILEILGCDTEIYIAKEKKN